MIIHYYEVDTDLLELLKTRPVPLHPSYPGIPSQVV